MHLVIDGASTQNNAKAKLMVNSSSFAGQEWYFERTDSTGAAWGFNERDNGYATQIPNNPFINCYLYALGISVPPNPLKDGLTMEYGDTVFVIAGRVENDIKNVRNRSIRRLTGPNDPISNFEYRFCMRVGNYSWNNKDYHFWVQTNTGGWADKGGWYMAAVNRGNVNPSTENWNMGSDASYYDSETVYFAATLSKYY